MKASTAIGIGAAIFGLLVGALMEGSQISAFIDPPAILIVFGGTFGATLAATSMESMKRIPSLYKKAMSTPITTSRGGSTCSSGWPKKPAAKAYWRSSRASLTSTTSSPAKACNWSSTEPNPR